jgi:hypothetical protein
MRGLESMRKVSALIVFTLAATFAGAQNTATLSGILTDSSPQPWVNATWKFTVNSPQGRPVFVDGSAVPASYSGVLSNTGLFSGSVGRTSQMQPTGITYTVQLCSLTSAACQTVTNVTVTGTTFDAGAALSPRITPLQIQSGKNAIFAYNNGELINPSNGDGYTNSLSACVEIFSGGAWVGINCSGEGGVSQITAGQNITINPTTGLGDVTIASPNPAICYSGSTTPFPCNVEVGGGFVGADDTWGITFPVPFTSPPVCNLTSTAAPPASFAISGIAANLVAGTSTVPSQTFNWICVGPSAVVISHLIPGSKPASPPAAKERVEMILIYTLGIIFTMLLVLYVAHRIKLKRRRDRL